MHAFIKKIEYNKKNSLKLNLNGVSQRKVKKNFDKKIFFYEKVIVSRKIKFPNKIPQALFWIN